MPDMSTDSPAVPPPEVVAERQAADAQAAAAEAALRPELERLRAEVERKRAELAEVTAERDRYASGLNLSDLIAGLRDDLTQQTAAELATARRDAAADALDYAARYIRRVFAERVDPDVGKVLEALARTTRSGTRPVPGSPEPAPADGEESSND